jgi:hypothetical protein
VALDRDEFDLLPEISGALPAFSGPARFRIAAQGGWFLGRVVRVGEMLSLLPALPAMLTSPSEVSAMIGAFRDLFVGAMPAEAQEEVGRRMDAALAMVRASAYAVALGRQALVRELGEERGAHEETLGELTDAEAILAEHGLLAEYARKRDARGGPRRNPREKDCRCDQVQRADRTRHFRGCPLREKYPEPAGVVIDVHQNFAGQDPDKVAEAFAREMERCLAARALAAEDAADFVRQAIENPASLLRDPRT